MRQQDPNAHPGGMRCRPVMRRRECPYHTGPHGNNGAWASSHCTIFVVASYSPLAPAANQEYL